MSASGFPITRFMTVPVASVVWFETVLVSAVKSKEHRVRWNVMQAASIGAKGTVAGTCALAMKAAAARHMHACHQGCSTQAGLSASVA
jgi:hypothetical protein